MSAVAVRWTPRSMAEVTAHRGEAFLAGYAESPGVPVHEAGHRFEAVPGAATAGRVGASGLASPVAPGAPETGRDAGHPRAAGEAEDILRMRRMQRRQVSRADGGAPYVRGA